MKKILITGVNSYVGNSLANWLAQYPNDYEVHKISVRGDAWKDKDFSIYDSIVHVAGIAHQRETKNNASIYYKVNRDLAIDLARKAQIERVKHFVFLSTMSVYGLETGVIDKDTPLNPKTHYGKSKSEAEKAIMNLQSDQFKVAIVRPPMIYGKGCPGNYQRLRSFALKTPIFPSVLNKRSMIYVDNLAEYLRQLINRDLIGVFCPQNEEYVNTSKLVEQIARNNNKKIYLTKVFNPFLRLLRFSTIHKVFGNLIYINDETLRCNFIEFKESIKKSEGCMR